MYQKYGSHKLTCSGWLESLSIPRNTQRLSDVKNIWENGADNCPPLKEWTTDMRTFKKQGRASHSSIFSQRKAIYNAFKE